MRPSQRLLYALTIWLVIALLSATFAAIEFAWPEWPKISDVLAKGWLAYGLLLAVLSLIDMWLIAPKKAFEVTRQVAHNIAAGAETKVTLKVTNRSRNTANFLLSDQYPEHSKVKGLPHAVKLTAGKFVAHSYLLTALKRGDAQFDYIQLLVNSRFSLWQRNYQYPQAQQVKVYPNFAALHHFILLSADQQTQQMGIRRSQRRGDGLEFHQLREYRVGDSIRQIDWRATSRLQKLISREYQEEKDQNVIFLLDSGRRMRTQDGDLSHFDHALNAMLLLSYIALRQGDAVGMLRFGGERRWLAPQKGPQHINALLNQVYDCHPTVEASDFIDAATALNKRIRKRALVVLISNLRDDDLVELEPAVRLLNQHHLLLVANLREQALDQVLEHPVSNVDSALRFAETLDYLHQRKGIQEHLISQGAIAVDTVPDHLASQVVNRYFDIKRSGRL